MTLASSAEAGIVFTGERVVPNAVEPQLWNEHISRYYFAQRFASGLQALDVGCGTGYGADLLSDVAESVVGFDVSHEAIQYAARRYSRPLFLHGSADAYPLASRSCDLVTAFEVIEHIDRWPDLIKEAARVLTPEGVFLVSTPNKHYYAETRADVGPNPFHVHEFECDEFESRLRERFAHVTILGQNQSESIVFAGVKPASAANAHIPASGSLSTAHYFLAVCSHQPVSIPNFSFVSDSGNVLRDRERHIRILKEEVRETHEQHLRLLDFHDELHRVLAERTERSTALETKLQALTVHRNGHSPGAKHNDGELRTVRAKLHGLQEELHLIRSSRWLRIGSALGLGPYSQRRFRPRQYVRTRLELFRRKASQWATAAGEFALYLLSFTAVIGIACALLCHDLCFALFGKRRLPTQPVPPRHDAASIIVPNWNGRDLLNRFLPSLIAAIAAHPGSEIIVVDNASTDDSVALLRSKFPSVRVLELATNAGFGKGSNAGVLAAVNEVVVLVNNDMRVEPSFLTELLRPFADPLVFATSAQIFLGDPKKRREETGLTEVWWEGGRLRVGHRADSQVRDPFPCAYPGGGSSAYDRRKFLELGGFDSLFHPFYYEDTDLGRMAWARGWKVLYVPASVAHHEHRATVSKNFSPDFVGSVVRKNSLLYCWKNLANWRILASSFSHCLLSLCVTKSNAPSDPLVLEGDARWLFKHLPRLLRSRWQAKTLRTISDHEGFRRPLGGYFRDRFLAPQENLPERLNVLFAAPYPIAPPVHGGAVFMREALAGLHRHTDVHLISFVDTEAQLPAQDELLDLCKTAHFMVRPHFSLEDQWTLIPNAVREFGVRDFAWAIHRTILQQRIDVLQLEYTILGQYAEEYRHIPCMLFEHDISAQSLKRRVRVQQGFDGDLLLEYARMRLYEPRLLKKFTRVQVCSEANATSLLNLSKAVQGKVDTDVRAGIDVARYSFTTEGREPDTLLFIGSFGHLPNVDALQWFISEAFPAVLAARPKTVLYVVGSNPPAAAAWLQHPNLRLLGTVPDVKIPLQQYSVFLCPIRSGSGVRVKLLEAFAMGIPAVSTAIGAEGLAKPGSPICELADSPLDFSRAVIRLLSDDAQRTQLALRARRRVEERWDSRMACDRLAATYKDEVFRLRTSKQESHAKTLSGTFLV